MAAMEQKEISDPEVTQAQQEEVVLRACLDLMDQKVNQVNLAVLEKGSRETEVMLAEMDYLAHLDLTDFLAHKETGDLKAQRASLVPEASKERKVIWAWASKDQRELRVRVVYLAHLDLLAF